MECFPATTREKLKKLRKLHKPPYSKRTRRTKTTTGTSPGDSKLHSPSGWETLASTGTTQGVTKPL
jgi:hypothetical protein